MTTYENLKPFFKKHLMLFAISGIAIIIFSPILYPILFIVTQWENIKEFTNEYYNEILSCFVIPYNQYFRKNNNGE